MIRSRTRPPRNSPTARIAIVAVVLTVLAPAVSAFAAGRVAHAARASITKASATTASATHTVRYDGIQLRVPATWPVFHLGARSTVCVRFDRHAVYLGSPGGEQDCPAQSAGRTEALLVSPTSYRGRLLTPVSRAAAGADSMARILERSHRVVITATWNRHPSVIRKALGLRSLSAAALATSAHGPAPANMPLRGAQALPQVTSPESPATPGEVYAGLGFDVCTTPSQAAMSAWGASSPYAAIGIYIGGANAACLGGNLTAPWVSAESVAGWHMIPIYVGLQSPVIAGKPTSSCGGCAAMSATPATAATQGTAAAQDAVAQAQALGMGTANPIYYDIEGYNNRNAATTAAVLAFLQAWTVQLHTSGYLSGVYSSGSSGIADLVKSYATTYVEPDELWTADWDSSAPATPPTSPANPYVPSADWPGARQLLQYYSDAENAKKPNETYGGVTIGIDRDYVDAPTAAYGSGTLVSLTGAAPTLVIKPQPDGSVNLTPSWTGAVGVTGYTILAGSSPTGLSAIQSVTATAKFPVKLRAVYAYYAVQALNSQGQVLGASPPIQAPAELAVFGNSGYVGVKGPVGIPVACQNLSPCRLQAQLFDGKRRIAHSGVSNFRTHGGQILVPLSTQTRRLVARATGRRLQVTVMLTSTTGAKISRSLNLIPYITSGAGPKRRTWPGSVIQVLASTSYVSNAWTGGALAVCRASTPCVSTVQVTLGGVTLASPHTTTLGPGEIGYLTYNLNAKGHRLLRAAADNQLGARLTVTTAAPSSTTTAPSSSGGTSISSSALALISLVSFG